MTQFTPIFFYLSTCRTCIKIKEGLHLPNDTVYRNIKAEPITLAELENMHALAGSYGSLFSRKAMKYRALGLDKMVLTEVDYKKYLLAEYTFLKRPVVITNKKIFIGNAKETFKAASTQIHC